MEKGMKAAVVFGMAAVLVAGFLAGGASAEQHVMCLKQVKAEVTSQLPEGFWQTPQTGNLVKKQIGNIGGKPTLMCGYKVYNTTVFIMHDMPAGAGSCRPDPHGFVCK